MLALLASWFPQRPFLAYGDSTYGGPSILRHLPANVDLVSHVHPHARMNLTFPKDRTLAG